MRDWKRWAPPLVAAALLVSGLLGFAWFEIERGFGVVLRVDARGGGQVCAAHACKDALAFSGTFRFLTMVSYWVGLLCALALVAMVVARVTQIDTGPAERLVGWACGAVAMLSILAIISVGPGLGEIRAGAPLTVLGALVGLLARATLERGTFEYGRSARPIRPEPLAVAPVAVEPARAVAPAPSLYELEQQQRRLAVAAGRASATGTAGVDAARAVLRFVVESGDIGADGLVVRIRKGGERTVGWAELTTVRTRRLPPEPPYEKTQFVDLVVAGGPPVRLVPTSRIDWARLPGGMGPSAKENWRRLVALAREKNPALAIEEHSEAFFAGGRDAPIFRSLKEFVDYDASYG